MSDWLRNPLAEFVGTLIFVFAIIGAINSGSALTPLVIGFALMIMVFATGHISGAHLNPAVSLGAWLRGAITLSRFATYVVAQLAAGAIAAAVSLVLWPLATKPLKVDVGPAFFVESLWTFVLVYVVLNVATTKTNVNNSFYGLAIGSTVFVGAVSVGSVSGGGFNPAVALGLSITGTFDVAVYWLYLIAPLLGGAVAALVFRALNRDDKLPALS